MEHGKVQDREWLAIVEATEQRIKASQYNITLCLIARQFMAHVKPYEKAYCFERLVNDDRIAIGATREVVEEVLKILKYREPDLYAGIKAAALSTNGDFEPDREALRECFLNGETHARHVAEVNEEPDPDSYEAEREAQEDALYHELDEKG